MPLNPGVLTFDSNGAIVVTSDAPDGFNGGTPATRAGRLCTVEATAAQAGIVDAIGYTAAGNMGVDSNSAIAGYTGGGLPVTSAGNLAVGWNSALSTSAFVAGVPIGSDGRVRVSPIWQIDANAAQIRSAISDLTTWGYSPHNLLTYSEQFDNGAWGTNNLTVGANTVAAPNGTTTADTITLSAGASVKNISQGATLTGVSTFSVYLKAGTHSFVQLYANSGTFGYVNADLSAGTVTASTATGSIIALSNGWYRVTATFAASITLAYVSLISSTSATRGESWTAVGTETVYIWGAQVNVGPTALTYVPTTSAALGPTAPGWTIPGAAGARLNGDARTSVAMQQAADGTWGFAPHNVFTQSVWAGAVAGSPGTAPTGWSFAFSTGSISAVAASGGDNALTLTASSTRIVLSQSFTATAGVTYCISVTVTATTGVTIGSLFGFTSQPAGSSITYLADGASVVSSYAPTAGQRIACVLAVGATGGTPSARIGVGATDVATGVVTFVRPQLNIGPAATAYVPTTTAARYGPAIDWLSAQSAYGLRSEPAATNSLRNNTMQGVVAGSQGTPPTNWTGTAPVDGLDREIVGTGTDSTTGMPYIDVRWYGTSGTSTTVVLLTFDNNSQIAAANGQTWTASQFVALTAGSLTNVATLANRIRFNDSGGATLTSQDVSLLTAVSTPTRYSQTLTASSASTAYVNSTLVANFTNSSAVDFTLRICAPQLEQGSVATSPILTYGATATRAADTLTVPNTAAGWISATQGTLAADGLGASIGDFGLASLNGASAANRIDIRTGTTSYVTTSSVDQATFTVTAMTANTLAKNAVGYKANDFGMSRNGAAASTDTSGTVPTTTQLQIGGIDGGTTGQLSGQITRIRYSQTRVADAVLQALTT